MDQASADRLLKHALGYPGAHEDHPWGETVVKVDGKIFVFFGVPADGTVYLTVKLPDRAVRVLEEHDFTRPTGYGLGKWGWISCTVPPDREVDTAMLLEWIELSYRAVAKKKRVKELDEALRAAAPGRPG